MKINSLKLHGWTGIKKGMKIDDLELDLRGLSGLIAFSGQNGRGKSTVLENLQPYRTLASRKKALPYHVYTRDASKALDFDFQGDNYKTKILIDADSGRQEGYIWKNGESVVDGKVRNYDAYIETLLGSKDLFFNSIFCAQNASKLSDLTTGKLKELFAEFLRLDQYIAYEATTKQCIVLLNSQAGAYTSQIQSIQARLSEYGDLGTKLAQAQTNLDQANETYSMWGVKSVELDAAISRAREIVTANKALEDRLKDIADRMAKTTVEEQRSQKAYDDKADGLRQKVRQCQADIKALSATLDNRDNILAAVERRRELAEEIEVKSKGVDAGYAKREKIQQQIREVKERINKEIVVHPDETRLPILKNQLSMLKSQVSDLTRRDPACTSTVCGFIATALEAQQAIPVLEAQIAAMVEALNAHQDKNVQLADGFYRQTQALEKEEASLFKSITELQGLLIEAKKAYSGLAPLAEQEGTLREAMARLEAAQQTKADATAQGMALKAELDEQLERLCSEKASMQAQYADLSTKIDTSAQKTLTALIAEQEDVKADKRQWEERIRDFAANVRIIQDQITEKTVMETQLKEMEDKAGTIQGQVSEWIYLKNALSANGIRALEIDSVAPSISAYANQILFNTFGPAYSVKLRTQDDEGREVLDILALQDDGSETLLDDLSGGQQVWCLKALRLALTLIAKQKSGRAFQVALSDEEDGALDAGNAQNFIHMYRAFMDAGGFDTCFFISHRPECVNLAEHVLEFGEGGVSIN